MNNNKRQPLNYRSLTWNRYMHTEYGGVKHVSGTKYLDFVYYFNDIIDHNKLIIVVKYACFNLNIIITIVFTNIKLVFN